MLHSKYEQISSLLHRLRALQQERERAVNLMYSKDDPHTRMLLHRKLTAHNTLMQREWDRVDVYINECARKVGVRFDDGMSRESKLLLLTQRVDTHKDTTEYGEDAEGERAIGTGTGGP